MNNHRPTKEDVECLTLLLDCDRLDAPSAQFIEDCANQEEEGKWTSMSEKQWAWFDRLAERYL